jgi:cytochrome oxidase Cu insertion factor (SCO1/SenC/PrrC family)
MVYKGTDRMLRVRAAAVVALGLITLLALLLTACRGEGPSPPATGDAAPQFTLPSGEGSGPLAMGDVAPQFTLPSADGQGVSLADFAGKTSTLLYFHMGYG